MLLTYKRLTLFIVALALFMDVLDSNVINTSIPAIAKSLQANPIDLKVALLSYLLSLAVFIPMSGWAADKYGAKKVFLNAFLIFTFSSFACGIATSLSTLVIARIIQGMGGAFMISIGRLIILRTFKQDELVEAMNTVVIVVSIAVMVGPFIGGFITEHWSWPWIFWINVPIGLLAITLANYVLIDNAPKNVRPFDWLGFILFGGSLALFCFSLSELSESNVNIKQILYLLVISILMFILYFLTTKRNTHPIINNKLLKLRTFQISVLGNLTARLGFGGMPFVLPLLYQLGLGYSPQLSGLLLMPMAFGIVVAKLSSLHILRKSGYRRFLIVNTMLVAITISFFQVIGPETPFYIIVLLSFLFGTLLSGQFTGINSLAFSDIHENEFSASTSITSTVQVLGQGLGVAVGAILLRFFSNLEQPGTLSLQSFHLTFLALSILTLLASLVFIRLKKEDGKQMLIKGA